MEKLAKVCVDTGLMSLDRTFDYIIPDAWKETLCIGHPVEVPFGGSRKHGIVVGFTEEASPYRLKTILRVTHPAPVLGQTEIELAGYMQKMYVASFYDCLKLMCPPGLFGKADKRVILTEPEEEEKTLRPVGQERILSYLSEEGGESTLETLKSRFGPEAATIVRALCEKKLVRTEAVTEKPLRPLMRKFVQLTPGTSAEAVPASAAAQRRVLSYLAEHGKTALSECLAETNAGSAVIAALRDKGFLAMEESEVRRNPFAAKRVQPSADMTPTEEQKAVLSTLCGASDEGRSDTFLLHGVTGSGKTEVYMQLIGHVLKKGKSAICLVPEISLTPQLTDRFISRFGDDVAILHSVLSPGERLDEWNRIRAGKAHVVVGARSAVFAPLSDIGTIIIDEEHESSYVSEQSPRYDAREVAERRCETAGAPLILASATPDVADYYRAEKGTYTLLTMKHRYNNVSLPDIAVADMRSELAAGNRSMFSEKLRKEIEKNLAAHEQTVLFLNRRGFSTFVSCRDCGYVVMCPSCSIALTYHKATGSLNCHYCGYREKVVTVCPECGGHHVRYFGTGTQRLEEEIHTLFPGASVLRMDVDTTAHKNGHEKILTKFREEKTDILLGTQMVAKGLDFPGISLVGVMAADMSLNIDDYRAAERTFNLITQVCGRAGRSDTRGRAVIQTYAPDNAVIGLAKSQDYEAFYESEIAYRQMFSYPPFSDIVCVTASAENEREAEEACRKLEADFRTSILTDVTYFPSAPAPLSRIKGRYRWRFWCKTTANMPTREKLREIFLLQENKNVRVSVVINPENMH